MGISVISIDPGITTGYCRALVDNKGCAVRPYQAKNDVWQHWDELKAYHPDIIIIEDFEYRKGQRDGLILFSVQLIGVTRLWAKQNNATLYIQKAMEGKSHFSNELLKDRGVYKRGMPHAMDATRHLIHWFTFKAGYQYVKPDDPIELL